MALSDRYVVQLDYVDSKGQKTRRVVSPIRFDDAARTMFLALCLCREIPRRFALERCSSIAIIPAESVLMPVPIIDLGKETHERRKKKADPKR